MGERETPPPKNELLRIARISTALALGFMAASLQALTRDAQGLQFRISVFTALAFVAAALVGWWYWRLVMQMIAPASTSVRKPTGKFILFSAVLFLAAVGSYIYRLRFVPKANVREVAEGVMLAFLVVGIIAFAMWRVVRFLENQDRKNPH